MYTWCEARLSPLVQVKPLFVFFNEGAHFGLSHFDGGLHHVAHVRCGSTLSLHHDGECVASAPFAETVDPLEPLFVGSQGNSNTRHPEEVAEFRVVRGLARYRGDFAPPARRFEEAEGAAGDRGQITSKLERLVLGFTDADFCKETVPRNTRWKAFDEIYKIYIYASFGEKNLLHISNVSRM